MASRRQSFESLTNQALVKLERQVELVVNTTSVGMYPQTDASPWPADVPMSPQVTFCDLVYNPLETNFLRQAHQAGAKTIEGLGMLIHQAAFGFEKWTGQPAPLGVMRQACLNRLQAG